MTGTGAGLVMGFPSSADLSRPHSLNAQSKRPSDFVMIFRLSERQAQRTQGTHLQLHSWSPVVWDSRPGGLAPGGALQP